MEARDYPHAHVTKLVFDMTTASARPIEVNPDLIRIADFIRQYGTFGKGSPQLKVIVVLHGSTAELALDASSSAKRTGSLPNGSIAVMQRLAGQGVRFVVSRQSLAARGIGEDEIQPIVHFGPTSEVTFLELEADGYVYEPAKHLAID